MSRRFTRRWLLRGAGVALALPWLESLSPTEPRAQTRDLPRRFLPIYLPNGAHEYWRPTSSGRGDEWQLSSILEPFGAALKPKLNIVTSLENGSVFLADGTAYVESSHGRFGAAWLTCVDAVSVRAQLGLDEANGISVDQVLAQHDKFKGKTTLDSLQVGLSTPFSLCDGEPCSSSRSVSWASITQPMYKLVDPMEVFNRIVGGSGQPDPTGTSATEAKKRVALKKSVLDAVLENAQRTRTRLGSNDQRRMDEFLESVRGVEKRVVSASAAIGGMGCVVPTTSGIPHVEQSAVGPRQTTDTYDKGLHADAMNDLIAMAFECDVTRIISYMLEDERSEFTYDNVQERAFTADSSTEKGGACPQYHVAQHSGADDFATITWWNVGKVADLCRKLDAIEEAPGISVLDNSVVFLGACMHGGSHEAANLPVALVGGGNLGLETDQHIVLDRRPLRDLYFTLMNEVYGLAIRDFGKNLTGAPLASITTLLKR
jgi:Protein of unknown function (DUF1552)